MAVQRSLLTMIIQKAFEAYRKMFKTDGSVVLDGSKTLNGLK